MDTSLIYKRQANVAQEPLRSIKTKEPRLSGLETLCLRRAMGTLMAAISLAAGREPRIEGNTEPPALFAAL